MKRFSIALAACLLLAGANTSASQSGFMRVDFWSPPEVLPLPDDLSALSTQELKDTGRKYRELLDKLHKTAQGMPDANKQYTSAQHEYDLARLKIADVLPGVIERYRVEGKLRELLSHYSDNFADFRTHMRQPEEPEYKFYDMHLSMTLVSMGVMLAQNPDVDQRFRTEINTPGTPLGDYGTGLDVASAKLDKIKAVVKAQNMERDLTQRLKRIDTELSEKRHVSGV